MPYISYSVKRSNINLKIPDVAWWPSWGANEHAHVVGLDAGAYPFFVLLLPIQAAATAYNYYVIRVIVKEPLKVEIFAQGQWDGGFRANNAWALSGRRILLYNGHRTVAVMMMSPNGEVTFGPTMTIPGSQPNAEVGLLGEFGKTDKIFLDESSGAVAQRGGGYNGRHHYGSVFQILQDNIITTLKPQTYLGDIFGWGTNHAGFFQSRWWAYEQRDDEHFILFWGIRYWDPTGSIGYNSTPSYGLSLKWNEATNEVSYAYPGANSMFPIGLFDGSGGPRNVVNTPIFLDPNRKDGIGAQAQSAFDNVSGYDIGTGSYDFTPEVSYNGWNAISLTNFSDSANRISQGPINNQVNWMPMQMAGNNEQLYIFHYKPNASKQATWHLLQYPAHFANGYVKGMVGATWGDRNTGERWFDIWYSQLNIAKGYVAGREYLDSAWDRTYAWKEEYFA